MSMSSRDEDLVTLEVPADVAAAVNARVAAGEFASQGDVVRVAVYGSRQD
ncbi:hypothetical protein [Kribbia dieselivorans]|nr:hypothetical protein [Kribbia dieselivorans]